MFYLFHQNETIMKTSSEYHLENPAQQIMHVFGQLKVNTSFLTVTGNYVMNKLTDISPFILILVPVFMLMVSSLFFNTRNVNGNQTSISSSQHTEFAEILNKRGK